MSNGEQKYNDRAEKVTSLLCVGIDPDMVKIPERFRSQEFPLFEFGRYIVDATAEHASAFKPNIAFYEAYGSKGVKELEMTMKYVHMNHPDIFTICDAKRGDIGNTNEQYATAVFDKLGFDAITLHPYMGKESLAPFLNRKDKTNIILIRTSNPGAGELQDLRVDGKPLWQVTAEHVRDSWNENGNCMLVVGATYPEEMKTLREIMGDMTFLAPGVGGQGGELEAVVRAGMNSLKRGLMINASRSIIYSDNPGEEAKKLKEQINSFRN